MFYNIIVSGGGPCGLITTILLLTYNIPLNLLLYEKRIFKSNNKYFFKKENMGNIRRKQVITLQNNVLMDLPTDITKLINENCIKMWPDSINIQIALLEDLLLEYIQMHFPSKNLTIFAEEFLINSNLINHFIFNCEGANSKINISLHQSKIKLNDEKALGIYFEQYLTDKERYTNVIKTLSQTRYLANTSEKNGYLNVRVDDSELQEYLINHNWNSGYIKEIISSCCTFFGVEYRNVKKIDVIELSTDYIQNPCIITQNNLVIFCLGDSFMKVHFWPGRGLNSAIKCSVASTRRLYWILEDEIKNLPSHLAIYKSFCYDLIIREQHQRSLIITNQNSILESISNINKNIVMKRENINKLNIRMIEISNRLKNRKDWIYNKYIFNSLLNEDIEINSWELALIVNTSEWQTKEMSQQEIFPEIICENPLKNNEQKI